ncbi:MAG: sialidase-1 [Sphingobacteriales bacterium]|jgi:sialidase-1
MKTLFYCVLFAVTLSTLNVVSQNNALVIGENKAVFSIETVQKKGLIANQDLTISLWVKLDTVSGYQWFFAQREGFETGYELWMNNDGRVGANIVTNNGKNLSYFSNTILKANKWYYLSLVLSSKSAYSAIFVNGVLSNSVNSAAFSSGVSSSSSLIIGAKAYGKYLLKGRIDDFSLINDDLNGAELYQLMRSPEVGGNTLFDIQTWRFEKNLVSNKNNKISYSGNKQSIKFSQNDNGILGAAKISSAECSQDELLYPAGIGNELEPILQIKIDVDGTKNPLSLNQFELRIDRLVMLKDIKSVSVYYSGSNQKFSSKFVKQISKDVKTESIILLDCEQQLEFGENYFWITASIHSKAKEFNVIDLSCEQILTSSNEIIVPKNQNPNGSKTLILEHKVLFESGTNDVHTYRIPSLITTSNGTLIAAVDARVDNAGDLGLVGNIDIEIKRSKSGGEKWTSSKKVIDYPYLEGASDCSMIVDKITEEVFLFFNYSDSTDTFQDPYFVKSLNNGKSWSEPKELTADLYSNSWGRTFITSGKGIQLGNGELRNTLSIVEGDEVGATIFGSNDHGETWFSSKKMISNKANESQLIELVDGSIMMNSRTIDNNYRLTGNTKDSGITWENVKFDSSLIEPKCNASIIRLSSEKNGMDKNRILFSNPSSTKKRENLTIKLSYDEGLTWPIQKVIYPGSAAYSSLTILEDKTIGILYESDYYGVVRFARLSLEWLTDGTDSISIE